MTLHLLGLLFCFSGITANPGTKFVFALPQKFMGQERGALLVMTPTEENFTPIEVKIRDTEAFETTRILEQGTPDLVHIGAGREMPVGSSVQSDYTFIVEASDGINLLVRNKAKSNSDCFLALPLSDLGKEYFVLTYELHGPYAAAFAVIISTGSVTDVSIALPSTIMATDGILFEGIMYGPGAVLNITLGEFDAVQLQAKFDLTGTLITTTEPVGVIVGSNRTRSAKTCKSHMAEMMPPIEYFGMEYVLVPAVNKTQHFRILSNQGNTSVRVYFLNGSSDLYELPDTGSFIQVTSEDNECLYVVSTKPVTVARFMSRTGDNDATMMLMAPFGKIYFSQYRITVGNEWHDGTPSFITYVIEKGNAKGLTLNGKSQNDGWTSMTYDVAFRPDLTVGVIIINATEYLTLFDLRHPDGVEFMAFLNVYYGCEAEGTPLGYGTDRDYHSCYTVSSSDEDFIPDGLQEEKTRDFRDRFPPSGRHCCIKEETDRQCEAKSSGHHCQLMQYKGLASSTHIISTTSPVSCYSRCLTVSGCFGVNYLDSNNVIKTCELLFGTSRGTVESSPWQFFMCSSQLFFKTVT